MGLVIIKNDSSVGLTIPLYKVQAIILKSPYGDEQVVLAFNEDELYTFSSDFMFPSCEKEVEDFDISVEDFLKKYTHYSKYGYVVVDIVLKNADFQIDFSITY